MEDSVPQQAELEIAQKIYQIALRSSIPLLVLGLAMELLIPSETTFWVKSQDLIWLGLAILFLAPTTLLLSLFIYYLKNEKKLAIVALLSLAIALGVLVYKILFY